MQLLIRSKVLTEEQSLAFLQQAETTEEPVELFLLKEKKLTRAQLGKALEALYKLTYVSLEDKELEEDLIELLGEEFILEKRVVPLSNAGGRLTVAAVDPSDRTLIDEITFMTGMRPSLSVISEIDFAEISRKYFNDSSASKLIEDLNLNSPDSQMVSQLQTLQAQREAEATDLSNPLVQLVNSILQDGIIKEASDIHIEPRRNRYTVRFRIDGILISQLDIPVSMESSMVTRIKVMAQMDISDHRRPQDGRMTLKHKSTEYNLRVNTLPVTDGREKIVIRILRPSKQINDFDQLGFSTNDVKKLEQLYQSPYGIVLVCGPTGSGKTTTLYTILHKINEDIRNISTVEDPVELKIEGLNQSQVNTKADYTFASSMRAMLRQDPDVIMVGEMRDFETLEAGIHAALTGHLVFSTIHSNTTAGTITRMVEMGASRNLIASALNGIIAQRLVRTICPSCKTPYEASMEEKELLLPFNVDRNQSITLYKGEGCSMCNNSGYKGRAGLYEIMSIDRELRQLINKESSDLELEDLAISNGMETLSLSGKKAVLRGETSFMEATRVLGPNLSGN